MLKGRITMDNTKRFFSNKITSVLIAVFVCALWGSLFPCVKLGYNAFAISGSDIPSIILFAGIRFAISGIVLIGIASIKNKKFDVPNKKSIMPIFWITLTSIVLHYSFTYIALSIGEGSKSAIIKQVGFLFLSCFAFLFDKDDHFSIPKLIAGILGFIGIIVTNLDGSGFTFGLSDVLLLLASLCSCISIICTKSATKTISPVQIVAYSQLAGGIFLLVVGLVLGGKLTHIDTGSVLTFTYICAASIAAYSLWNILIKYNNVSKLSVIKFTEPLFAVIFSGIILGEEIFRLSYIIAFVIILAAILISNIKRSENL